jgi:hypothetical protein
MTRTSKRRALFGSGALLASLTWVSLVIGGTGEVSFTPTGLKLSIMQISLTSTDDAGQMRAQQVLYTCPQATEGECLVDVTDQSALDAIAAAAASATVQPGTYDKVSLDLCAPGKGGNTRAPGFVRGVFTVASEGKTYATEADASNVTGLKEVAAGEDAGAEFAAIGNWSCSQKTVTLHDPLVVEAGSVAPVTVVMDAKLIAFSTPNVSPGMGGCRGVSNGQGRGFCVSYPSIFPLIDDANPELERFTISHHRTEAAQIDDAKANAYVVVARHADGGAPVTAFVRPYYSETSARPTQSGITDPVFGGPAYFGETLVPSFRVNPDGSVRFVTGGSLDGLSAIFEGFDVAEHVGVVTSRDGGSWQYHAIPVP